MIEQAGTQRIAGLVLVDGSIWTANRPAYLTAFEKLSVELLRDRRAFAAGFVRGMYQQTQDPAYLGRITEASFTTPTSTAYTLLAST